jgi:small subunit ribosomal protein S17e
MLGNVRTDQIKRTAKELVRRFPDKFSRDFEKNKELIATLTEGTTVKIRNQIAGYISHSLAAEEEEPVSEAPMEEDEEEEKEQA